MLLILSGEGASDFGGSGCYGDRPGPMAMLVDQIIEDRYDYSPFSCSMVQWHSRVSLSDRAKKNPLRKISLPGVKRPQGYLVYYTHANTLARIAKEQELEAGAPSLSVMFRDSDGTSSSPQRHWDLVTEAIAGGFADADYSFGVAMVPKPKQEGWLVCALKEEPYISCQYLEDESGNDSSPEPLKKTLANVFGREPTTADMCEWIEQRRFDHNQMSMPSFLHFKSALHAALDRIEGRA